MKKTPLIHLHDMLQAIEAVEGYLRGMSFADFTENPMAGDATERCLERLSEASRRIDPALKEGEPGIAWREIAALGNVLRHEYHRVDAKIIWKIYTEQFPALKEALARMIACQP